MADGPFPKHHLAVCKGDATLKDFMRSLMRFLANVEEPTHFTDDNGVPREGIAYTWAQWADDLGLTEKQIRRVLEKAEDLGFIIRARRVWRWEKYRGIRLHVAVTVKYTTELTQCVAIGHKAYSKAIKEARQQPTANVEGQYHVARLGSTMLPTEGSTVLPTEGNYIEDSSQTHIRTLRETATSFAVADSPSALPETESKKEKSEILESESIQETNQIPEEEEIQRAKPENANGEDSHLTHTINFGVADLTVTTTSVELFEKFSVGNAKDAGHVATVTSHGLATKFSALGLLTEWQRQCAKHRLPSPDNVTDEQLAALAMWCNTQSLPMLDQLQREKRIGLYTGARTKAILQLTWDRIDLPRRWVDFRLPGVVVTSKRRPNTHLNFRLVRAFRAFQRKTNSEFVIAYRDEGMKIIRNGFMEIAKKAGVKGVTPHVLKHTAITWLLHNKLTPWQVSGITATSVKTIMKTYGHHIQEDLEDAVNVVINKSKGAQNTRNGANQRA